MLEYVALGSANRKLHRSRTTGTAGPFPTGHAISKHLTTTAGARDPVQMQGYRLLEELAHQIRERVPERVVHAKG